MCDSKNELHKSENSKAKDTSATRLDLDITEATDTYPEFDFLDLLRNLEGEQKKVKRKEKHVEESVSKSQLSSEDSAEALARIYEEKYGTCNDYADLGDGYDEEDSFIDNTDAINDLVPNGLRTEFGGFYINRGKLNFVKEDNSSSSNSENVDKFLAQNRLNARRIVSDDEEKGGHENGRTNSHAAAVVKSRKRSGEFHHKQKTVKKMRKMATPKIPDHLLQKKPFSGSSEFRKNINEFKKNRQKSSESEPTDNNKKEVPVKKRAPTVKDLLKERDGAAEVIEAVATGADLLRKESKKESSSSSGSTSSSSSDSESETSSDAKEKTVENANERDREKEKEKEAETEVAEEAKDITARDFAHLHDNLKDLTGKILEVSKAEKNRLFNNKLNLLLLSVDDRVKDLPAGQKNLILEQLAGILQMKRESIIKRTKKLLYLEEEAKMAIPLKKLKEGVSDIMPLLESNYLKEFTKAAGTSPQIYAELSRYYWSIDPGSLPQRKFPWDTRLRSYLREIVELRKNCYFIIRPRKESLNEFVRSFLESKLQPLWPKGWMTADILWEESQPQGNSDDKQKVVSKIFGSYNTSVTSGVTSSSPVTMKKASPSTAHNRKPAAAAVVAAGGVPRKPDRTDAPSVLIPRKTPHGNHNSNTTPPAVPGLPPNSPNHDGFHHPAHPSASSRLQLPPNRPVPPRPHHLSPHKISQPNSVSSTGRTSSPTSVIKTSGFRNCVGNSASKVQTIEIHSNPVSNSRPPTHLSPGAESLLKEVPPGVTSNEILNLTKNSSISISKVVEDGDPKPPAPPPAPAPLGISIPSGITICSTNSSAPGYHKPRSTDPPKINVTLTRQEPLKREGALQNIPDCISVTSTSSVNAASSVNAVSSVSNASNANERHRCEPVRKRMLQEYREQMSANKGSEEAKVSGPGGVKDDAEDKTFDGFSKIFDSVIAKSVETVRKTEKTENKDRDMKTVKAEGGGSSNEDLVKMEMDRVMQNLMELSNQRNRDQELDLAPPRHKTSSFQDAFQKMLFK